MKSNLLRICFALILVTLLPSFANAWGGRGHAAICEAAVFLVRTPGLKDFLRARPHTMAHLCIIPDAYWRSLPTDAANLGAEAHYIDPEVLGLAVPEIPLDFKKLEETYTNAPNKFNEGKTIGRVAKDFGSLWWRADQFIRRASGVKIADLQPPVDRKQEQDEALPYNKAVYEFMVNLGLAGHFVGDASQPLHNSANYDGWKNGHGGLHGYFEEGMVAQFGPDLINRVVTNAEKMKNPPFLKGDSLLANMRSLSDISQKEIATVYKLDSLKAPPQTETKSTAPTTGRAPPPARESEAKAFKPYEKMIVTELARSALLLARLWEDAYAKSGSPDLSTYRLYKYPLMPDFVAPDYVTAPAPESKPAKK